MELTEKDRQLERNVWKICDSKLKKEGKGLGAKLSYDLIGSLFLGASCGGATYAVTKNIPLALKVAGISSAVFLSVGVSGTLDLYNDEIYRKMEPLFEKAGMNSHKRAILKSEYDTY